MCRSESLESTIGTGNLEVDLDKRLVTVDGNPVKPTQREYEIRELLSSCKGTIVMKEMFLDRLYAGGHEPAHKIIDIFVCKLRHRPAQKKGAIRRRAQGATLEELARSYNVSRATISRLAPVSVT